MKQQQYQQVQYQYTLYKALKNKGDSNKYVIRQNIFYFYCWCPFFKYEHDPTNNAPVWILWSKSNLSQSLMPLESFTQFNALSHVISACAYLLPVMIISHVISQLPWKGQHVNVVVCYTITNNWSAHVLKTKGICTMQGSGKQWLKKHANAGIFIMFY